MVSSLKCECSNRYGTDINSVKDFDEIKLFFDKQVINGVYLEEKVLTPYYVWKEKNEHIEYYATKWYRCKLCGCLWEFNYPDFPSKGFVNKYEDGIYTGMVMINNNEEPQKPNVVLKSQKNNNIYYMFSAEILIHCDNNKIISITKGTNVVSFYNMYYEQDELIVVVSTKSDFYDIYVLDEERKIIKKRNNTT